MNSRHRPQALLGMLTLAWVLSAADGVAPTMIQTKAVALDPVVDQTRGGLKWSHGAFLFEEGGPGGNPRIF